MRNKANIPALIVGLLFLVASNGVAISEHICGSSGSRGISFISKSKCACGEMADKQANGCCKHKQIISKLNYEGFTATPVELKSYKIINVHYIANDYSSFVNSCFVNQYSGIPPPDNLHISYLLRPTPASLQIYRC